MPNIYTINPTANLNPNEEILFRGSSALGSQMLDEEYTAGENPSSEGWVFVRIGSEFRHRGMEIFSRDVGFGTARLDDSPPSGVRINFQAHPESESETLPAYLHVNDTAESDFWRWYIRHLNRRSIAGTSGVGIVTAVANQNQARESSIEIVQHGSPVSAVGQSTNVEGVPRNSAEVESAAPRTYWVNRLLVLASIIAFAGIVAIYWGTSINSRELVYAGVLIFTAAVAVLCVPFLAVSYWLVRDGFKFAEKWLNRR